MGLNANGLRHVLRAARSGADLTSVGTIGRQGVHINRALLRQIVQDEFGLAIPCDALDAAHATGFVDALFGLLGAREVVSYDASDYEDATVVHDFNTPLPPSFDQRHTFVFDGGSLEHIFHFSVALHNAMRLVKVGGTYLGASGANNQVGHGFYQISPEVYFRAFSGENGFKVSEIFLIEGREARPWLLVRDPAGVGRRTSIATGRELILHVLAERVDDRPIFACPPQQSDYVHAWNVKARHHDGRGGMPASTTSRRIAKMIPSFAKPAVRGMRRRLAAMAERFQEVFLRAAFDGDALVVIDPVDSVMTGGGRSGDAGVGS